MLVGKVGLLLSLQEQGGRIGGGLLDYGIGSPLELGGEEDEMGFGAVEGHIGAHKLLDIRC